MLKVAENKLVVGKEEYHAFSAEMHYFRVNKRHWSICFERIRKAGFRIISTRVPWNLHESAVGDFDFMGLTDHAKDLVVFLELAREFGLKVILHPGPFIGSDWKNGGYPDFLYNSPEIIAKSPEGKPVQIQTGGNKEGKALVFSPIHPRFLNHVKRYFGALADIIKSYVYPKGPVILVKLDNAFLPYLPQGSSDNLNPFASDYNEHLITYVYPDFLKQKYQDIKKLKQIYGEKHRDFKDFKPPTELKVSKPHHLIKYFDWMEFKEKVAGEYISRLKELYLSFEVSPLFSTELFLSRDFSVPFNWQATESDELFTGINLAWRDDYVELTRHLRYYATCSKFPWASEFNVGGRADSPKDAAKFFPIPPKRIKFLLVTAMATGLKGFNHYMFVERDHWYDAPLANDGTIHPTFDLIKRFNEVVTKIELDSLKSEPQVGLAVYRPYLWYDFLWSRADAKTINPFPHIPLLLGKTHKGLSQDLISLKLNHGMPDLWNERSLKDFPILMVPCAEFMDEKTQQSLINLIKEGRTLILFGLLPKFDLNMRPCKLLSSFLKLQTKEQSMVGQLKTSEGEFTASIYGHIKGAKRSQVQVKYLDHPVGVAAKLGKGHVFVFTFDMSSQLHHPKMSFLEEVLDDAGAESPILCDDPAVELVFQSTDEHTILFLIDPSKPCASDVDEKSDKKIILRFDPRKIGVKGKRIRMTDLLGEEVIKTSPQELRTGIQLTIQPQDSRMYLIESK